MNRSRTILGSLPITLETGYRLILPDGEPPSDGFPVLLALHGFGLDGEILEQKLAALIPASYALLLPDGPYPVELQKATPPRVGRSWYQYTGDQPAFLSALDLTIGHLERLLIAVGEAQPLDLTRVALLGYSQGGYVASFMALRKPASFIGLVTISCRIKVEALEASLRLAAGFPVLVIHGRRDRVVALAPQEESIRVLREHGADVELSLHEGGHNLSRDSIGAIDGFVRRLLVDRDSAAGD